MTNSLQESDIALQEVDLIKSTLQRVEEVETIMVKNTLPEHFQLDDEGLWYLEQRKNGTLTRIWISSPLMVTAYTRDHKSENHGRILEFQDVDGQRHCWTMPMELLASEGAKILAALLNMGLRISPIKKSKDRLLEYITLCQPCKRARCVLQTGWFNEVFVLPSKTIGFIQNEKIIYQNPSVLASPGDTSGTLDEWKSEVSKKAEGNSRLLLALSASFTGPLLKLLNHENIGLHFRGGSSLGKSTAAIIANSVWGNKGNIHSFRATANGLEGIASLHNDRLLSLDELGQLSAQDAGHVIYMLGNGVGKARATPHGLAKKQATWRLVLISNGELSLEQLMNEVGKRVKAGQEVRFVEIHADTGCYGLFETIHGFENGADFSKCLQNVSSQYYGTASQDFLKKLLADIAGAVEFVKSIINGVGQQYLPEDASPQVIRVFNHFALIAAAGELASNLGVTGWVVEEAIGGVMKCFQAWLDARGGLGMHEEREALSKVKNFFELHGESRFSAWTSEPWDTTRTMNRAGFRKSVEEGVEFYVYPESFRKEICRGLDYRFVEKVCVRHKLLLPGVESITRPERLPESKNTTRCYRFTSEVLSG